VSEKRYNLVVDKNLLLFKTPFFSAAKGSILHVGIYNREMTSILASSILTAALIFVTVYKFGRVFWVYPLALVAITLGFILFRTLVFKESLLTLTMDKAKGEIRIDYAGVVGRHELFRIDDLESVHISHKVIPPENVDGIKVVEKIALQHGTVIPGFGEEIELFPVEMQFKDGTSRVVYSDTSHETPMHIIKKLKEFTGIA